MNARTADVLTMLIVTVGQVLFFLGGLFIVYLLVVAGHETWAFGVFLVVCFMDFSYKRIDDEAPEHVVRELDGAP